MKAIVVAIVSILMTGCTTPVSLTETGLFGTWTSRSDASLQVEFADHFSDADAQKFFLANKNANVYAIKKNDTIIEAGQFEVKENTCTMTLFVSFRNDVAIGAELCIYQIAEGQMPEDLNIGSLDASSSKTCVLSGGSDFAQK